MTPDIAEIVTRWKQRARKPDPRVDVSESQRPVVALSGSYGAYTGEIGQRLAEQLGFDLFGRDLVGQLVESTKARRQVAASLDDQQQGLIAAHIASRFRSNAFTSSQLMRNLASVVLTIGQHGDSVIVGRAVQHILAPGRTLRARVTAPLQLRVQRVVEQDGLDDQDARAAVLERDAERSAFYRRHFDRDVGDPLSHDVVLNSVFMGPEQAAATIVQAFRDRFQEHERFPTYDRFREL